MKPNTSKPTKPFYARDHAARLLETVARWSAQFPELLGRLAEAQLLVLDGSVATSGAASWQVASSRGGYHTVTIDEGFVGAVCTCEDHQHRKVRCKHILGAALYHAITKKPSRQAA
jgi:hypothetical protein